MELENHQCSKFSMVLKTPDSGNISTPSDFFHLVSSQDMEFEEGQTVWGESFTVFAQLTEVHSKLIISTMS